MIFDRLIRRGRARADGLDAAPTHGPREQAIVEIAVALISVEGDSARLAVGPVGLRPVEVEITEGSHVKLRLVAYSFDG